MQSNKKLIIIIGVLLVLICVFVFILISLIKKDNTNNNIDNNLTSDLSEVSNFSNNIEFSENSDVSLSINNQISASNDNNGGDNNLDINILYSNEITCNYLDIKGIGFEMFISGVGKSINPMTNEVAFEKSGKGKDFLSTMYLNKFKVISGETSTKQGYNYSIINNMLDIEYSNSHFYVACIKKQNIEDLELNIKINDEKNIFSGIYKFEDESFNEYTYISNNNKLTIIDVDDKDYYIMSIGNISINEEFYCDDLASWEYSNTEKDYENKFGILPQNIDVSKYKYQ